MFFLVYIGREVGRRAGRTAVIVLCLGLATGLVLTVSAVAGGLDAAQARVLNPLGGVGTDLTVSRDVTAQAQGQAAAGPSAATSSPDVEKMWAENQELATTDLSKLGSPGQHFSHDFFLPGNQLTFPEQDAARMAKQPNVVASATALSVVGTHQEGTVPQFVASFQGGGETVKIDEPITPPTAAERQAMQGCLVQLEQTAPRGPSLTPGKEGPIQLSPEAIGQCWPQRLKRFQKTIVTPQTTVKQVVAPPQTDITSSTFTVIGVDPANSLGVISHSQVTKGRFFSTAVAASSHEALVSNAYASRRAVQVGADLTFNGTAFRVVGVARPALGVQAADVYLTLPALQQLSNRQGRVNMVFLRVRSASDLDRVVQQIQTQFPGMQVASSRDLARKVRGSLVDAAAVADRLGMVISAVVLAVAALLASLLTLGAIRRRVRELGTLKAIGWSRFLLVRQMVGESFLQSVLGAALGVALGVIGARVVEALAPPFAVSTPAAAAKVAFFGNGQISAAGDRVASIPVTAGLDPALVGVAVVLAVMAGLVAGFAAAVSAARLRPMEALREVG